MKGQKIKVACTTCGWRGVRTDGDCECYDEWALFCRPSSPGPGCPRGVVWPCPRCGVVEIDFGGVVLTESSVVVVGQVAARAL